MNLDEKQQAARDQFDRQSDRYGRQHILADTGDLDRAVDRVDFPAGGLALDVATGGGHAALWLARRGFDVSISDISEKMLENAAALLGDAGFACRTTCHPAETLPYLDAAFDVVTCRVAAHHFSAPAAFVREAARVLRPGGCLLVIDGAVPDDDSVAAEWANQVEKLRDPSHGRLMPPREWCAYLEGANLSVLKCEISPFKQPDLEWYFETANTPAENREMVRNLVRSAPPEAHRAFAIATDPDGPITWFWMRLTLVARRPGLPD